MIQREYQMNNGFSTGEEDSRGNSDQICCLVDDSDRCRRLAGNASYSKRIQKTVALKRLKLNIDHQARHTYICDYHKTMIQCARTKQRRNKDSEDDSNEAEIDSPEVDWFQLQVNTLRRYKKHYKVPTRPGLNKSQLADVIQKHFKSLPVNEKEIITYFIYMVKTNDIKPERHQLENFVNGTHLRIGTINSYPDSWAERTENGTYIGRGVAFDLVHILQKKFNFTYEVVVPEGNILHSDDRPQESLIGLLHSKRIDVAAAFIPILKNTDKYVTFSTVIDESNWMMLLRRPKESAAGSGLLAPFDENVWLLTLAAVIIYGPCLTLLTKLRSKLMPDDENYIRLSPSFWFVYGAFIKQGTSLSPSANTTRVLFATWWLFIILLSAFYTANLTAFLTLSKFTLDIETVQDLYKKNYRWIAPEGSAVENTVKNPDEEIHFLLKTVATGRGSFLSVRDPSSLLNYVSEGAVLVHPSVSLQYLMYNDYLQKTRLGVPEAERCTYVVAPGVFMTKRRAFAYQHKSKLKSLFNPVIKRVIHSGILSHLSQRNLPDTKICPLDLQSKDRQLRNTDLLMTYYIMMTGLAAAVAVFLAEISLKRYIHPKRDGIQPRFRQKRSQKIEPATFDDSRPPPYESLFGKTKGQSKKKIINGREYWVIKKENGETRLIPVRTPSALLYR